VVSVSSGYNFVKLIRCLKFPPISTPTDKAVSRWCVAGVWGCLECVESCVVCTAFLHVHVCTHQTVM
jgi:hypothetical protein